MELTGISPLVDSVGGMIAMQARHVHYCIGKTHRAWIDPEDIIQDGLIFALETEKKYDKSQVAKFSTYLYQGLHWHYDHAYLTPLGQRKRTGLSVDLTPLEAVLPAPSGPTGMEGEDAIRCLERLCYRLTAEEAAWLVGSFLCGGGFGVRQTDEVGFKRRVKEVADSERISMSDLLPLAENENLRKKSLTRLSGYGKLGMGNEMAARLLECVECGGRLPLAAIPTGRYIVETMTCGMCYKRMAASPPSKYCFGKEYNEAAVECRIHCVDRMVCKQYKEGRKTMTTENENAALDAVDLGDIDTSKVKKTKKATKAAPAAEKAPKTEKAPKAEKAPKVEVEAPPKELGPRWPYKTGSAMLYMFQRMYEGVKTDELKAEIEKSGFKWGPMLGTLRREDRYLQRNPTHTWKLKEDGGFLKIYDVKYIGQAKAPKAETPAKAEKAPKTEATAAKVSKTEKAAKTEKTKTTKAAPAPEKTTKAAKTGKKVSKK